MPSVLPMSISNGDDFGSGGPLGRMSIYFKENKAVFNIIHGFF